MEEHFQSAYTLTADTTYTVNGSTYTTNENGCISKFTGKPTLDSAPRSASSQRNLAGKETGDHASHLVAASNGGSGKVDNMVPMDGKVNTRDYRGFERQNNDLLRDGKEVTLHGELAYHDQSNRPDAIMVTRETVDPVTNQTDIEHFSWTNTDMAQYENNHDWVALADEFENPGAVIVDDQGNIVSGPEESFDADMAGAAAGNAPDDSLADNDHSMDGQDNGNDNDQSM